MSPETFKQINECFVSERITGDLTLAQRLRANIRKIVCEHLPADYQHNDNFYCVLHYPDINKRTEFTTAYTEKKNKKDFNFQWTYFPDNLFIADKTIEVDMDFSNARFAGGVYLISTKFKDRVSFAETHIDSDLKIHDATFSSDASFQGCQIKIESSIKNTTFDGVANFADLHSYSDLFIAENWFNKEASFSQSNFRKSVSFNKSKFKGKTTFNFARFSAEASFNETFFESEVRFDKAKFARYTGFRQAKFSDICVFDDCNFFDVADFYRVDFDKTAQFARTKFAFDSPSHEREIGAYFRVCKFKSLANFPQSKFKFGSFENSEFEKECVFDEAEFAEKASFEYVNFIKNASFKKTRFQGKVSFNRAAFNDYIRFEGDLDNEIFYGSLELQNLNIIASENIYFHTVRLNPSWFVNIDPRKFVFTRIEWKNLDGSWRNKHIETELKNIEDNKVPNARHILKIACRQLATNYEENNRFEEASKFRRMSFECERLEKNEKLKKEFNNMGKLFKTELDCPFNSLDFFPRSWKLVKQITKNSTSLYPDVTHRIYRWTSNYGESWLWSAMVLFIMVFTIFPFVYTLVDFQICPAKYSVSDSMLNGLCIADGLHFWEAVRYSLATATFQTVEYLKPMTGWSETWIIFEKIFAPLQAALLALALRRKFMR